MLDQQVHEYYLTGIVAGFVTKTVGFRLAFKTISVFKNPVKCVLYIILVACIALYFGYMV